MFLLKVKAHRMRPVRIRRLILLQGTQASILLLSFEVAYILQKPVPD